MSCLPSQGVLEVFSQTKDALGRPPAIRRVIEGIHCPSNTPKVVSGAPQSNPHPGTISCCRTLMAREVDLANLACHGLLSLTWAKVPPCAAQSGWGKSWAEQADELTREAERTQKKGPHRSLVWTLCVLSTCVGMCICSSDLIQFDSNKLLWVLDLLLEVSCG